MNTKVTQRFEETSYIPGPIFDFSSGLNLVYFVAEGNDKLHGEDHRRSAAVAAHGGAGDAGGGSRLEAELLPGLAAGADVPRSRRTRLFFESGALMLNYHGRRVG